MAKAGTARLAFMVAAAAVLLLALPGPTSACTFTHPVSGTGTLYAVASDGAVLQAVRIQQRQIGGMCEPTNLHGVAGSRILYADGPSHVLDVHSGESGTVGSNVLGIMRDGLVALDEGNAT